FPAAAAGEMANSAEREHLRTVFAGGDVSHRLSLRPYQIRLRTQVSISIDLYLDPAVAEDALRDDCDHVNALYRGRNDERGRFIVGVCGARANRRDKGVRTTHNVAIPFTIAIKQRDDRIAT